MDKIKELAERLIAADREIEELNAHLEQAFYE
jgi:hypothetical protein